MEQVVNRPEVYENITKKCLEIYDDGKEIAVDEILMQLMDIPGVPMHDPFHHYIMPAAPLTAAALATGEDRKTLEAQLAEAQRRGKTVPGGFCGDCGACGSGVGAGIFLSVYTGAGPKKRENWALVNRGTAHALMKVSSYPGPRCCKRVLFLATQAVCEFTKENLKIDLKVNDDIVCRYFKNNKECLGKECPFFKRKGEANVL